jgi:hypothetical protein
MRYTAYMRRLCLSCFFFLIFILITDAQSKTRRFVSKEYYPDGAIWKVVHTRITTNACIDLHNYYKRTVQDVAEFYENGKMKSRTRKIRKLGDSGRPYYEMLTDEQYFNEKGVICCREISKFDKRKIIRTDYDEQGKVAFESIVIVR